jgi:acyl carrier protein
MERMGPHEYIITRILKALSHDIEPDALLSMQLGATGLDSLEFIEMLNDIEDSFEIRFDDQALGDGKTVEDLIAYVAAQLESKA